MRVLGVVLVLALVACGDPDGPSGSPGADVIEIGVTGVNASGPVLLHVDGVGLRIDGAPVDVLQQDWEIDLGEEGRVWSLFSFDLPRSSDQVLLDVVFDGEGFASYEGETRAVDLGGPPLSLSVNADVLRRASGLVLEIDIDQSLTTRDGRVHLLPSFVVRY